MLHHIPHASVYNGSTHSVYRWDNSSFINHIYHYSCFFSVFKRKCSKFTWIYWTRSCLHTHTHTRRIHNMFVRTDSCAMRYHIASTFFRLFICLFLCSHARIFVFYPTATAKGPTDDGDDNDDDERVMVSTHTHTHCVSVCVRALNFMQSEIMNRKLYY